MAKREQMNYAGTLPMLKLKRELDWKRSILDSLLALGSIFSLTAVIWLFQLYERIPDSFLVYVLAILLLASLRGLYSALFASLLAFFSFDFLFVPPLYSLSAAKFEDVLTLAVFLVTAIITSQLVSVLRQRVEDANRMVVLQRTDELRSALLSSVSHDLRTPLTTIKTAATSLGEGDVPWDDEARHGFIAAIEREADRLDCLVENLLDMSRIEAGLLQPEKVWYLLDELVREVLDRMAPLLQGREVQTHLPDHFPPLELDNVLIDQVLTNLLENAVRYTPAGTPIEVSMQKEGDEGVVSIADRGPGIMPEERELIFDKFYRVCKRANSAEEEARGSGLGLAICRGLMEAHGGRIWVEAREGGGAVFRFALPLNKAGEVEL
jgi:K+-sensing histidine kinase KdpD